MKTQHTSRNPSNISARDEAPKTNLSLFLLPLLFLFLYCKGYAQLDKAVENYGGKNQMRAYLYNEMLYPEKALAEKKQGDVIINFTVKPDGSVHNAHVSQSLSPELDAEAMRLFEKILWSPATSIHGPVESHSSFSVRFNIKRWNKTVKQRGYTNLIYHHEPVDASNHIYKLTETDRQPRPRFERAEMTYSEFMANNLKYPEQAKIQGIEGKVSLSFVVETNGKPSNVFVTSPVGGGCSEEAVRLVQMLNWHAGVKDGKAVRTQMSIDITFSLQGSQQNTFEPTNSMMR